MAVSVGPYLRSWFCHRASCDAKGSDRFGNGIKSAPKLRKPVVAQIDGYNAYPVLDNNHTLKGYVHYAREKSTRPKRLSYFYEDWCGLHFPERIVGSSCLLVEDLLSARIMAPHFPTVALLGTHLNQEKVDYLYDQGIDDCIIALDNDATDKAIKIHRLTPIVSGVIMLSIDLKDDTPENIQRIAERIHETRREADSSRTTE